MGHHKVAAIVLSVSVLVLGAQVATAATPPRPARAATSAGTTPSDPTPASGTPAASIEDLLDLGGSRAAAPPPAAVATAPATGEQMPPREDADAAAIPPGAPDDDYGLVAWCQGALTGHMALFPVVKPELDRMEQTGDKAKDAELDAEQQAAGREYLDLYAGALKAAEARGDGTPGRAAGLVQEGERIWAPVQTADANDRMWSWVMWELPARCETAARRLAAGTSESSDVLRRHSSDDASGPAPAPAPTDSPVRR